MLFDAERPKAYAEATVQFLWNHSRGHESDCGRLATI